VKCSGCGSGMKQVPLFTSVSWYCECEDAPAKPVSAKELANGNWTIRVDPACPPNTIWYIPIKYDPK
jgi:hypothetical protein